MYGNEWVGDLLELLHLLLLHEVLDQGVTLYRGAPAVPLQILQRGRAAPVNLRHNNPKPKHPNTIPNQTPGDDDENRHGRNSVLKQYRVWADMKGLTTGIRGGCRCVC